MKFPLAGNSIDERFLEHRRRSTSIAGMSCAILAIVLCAWRFYVDGILSWDLFAVVMTNVVIKVGLMLWYRIHD